MIHDLPTEKILQAAMRAGADFAVIGFDDIAESAFATPALTTIATEPRARGLQAARLVLARLRGELPASPHTTIAPVALQVRASTAAAPDSPLQSSVQARGPAA